MAQDDEDWLPLSDPDIGTDEMEQALLTLRSPQLSMGPQVAAFEQGLADWVGQGHGVAVGSGTLGACLVLKAWGIGAGDEVITTGYAWHQVAHAITLVGATPVLVDIDYWSGCIDPAAAERAIGARTRALIATNVNGHPADWAALRSLADRHGLKLLEDSTEAIGSRYQGRRVGNFGDAALFDFSQPSALCTGQGGMVLCGDASLADELRYLRERRIDDRKSVSVGSRVPWQAGMGELQAAVGQAQLGRIDDILLRRKQVEAWYHTEMQSFEGIKPPYLADDVDEVHWMLYQVHLGKRFTASARQQLIEDLDSNNVASAAFCQPLHQQFFYQQQGWKRGALPNTERIGDRSLVLPFHGHLDADHVRFIVKTLKDASVNVGAGAAIYL
jgi:perosamine synthetase